MTELCQGFCRGEYGKFELEGTLLPLLSNKQNGSQSATQNGAVWYYSLRSRRA